MKLNGCIKFSSKMSKSGKHRVTGHGQASTRSMRRYITKMEKKKMKGKANDKVTSTHQHHVR
jgi:hypothetical protein